jgi:hypothetical protein
MVSEESPLLASAGRELTAVVYKLMSNIVCFVFFFSAKTIIPD